MITRSLRLLCFVRRNPNAAAESDSLLDPAASNACPPYGIATLRSSRSLPQPIISLQNKTLVGTFAHVQTARKEFLSESNSGPQMSS